MTPETKLRIFTHYLAAGTMLTFLGGYIAGFLPVILIDRIFSLGLYQGSPYLFHSIAFVLSVTIISLYIYNGDEWKLMRKAKRTGRAVHTTLRGYAIKFMPDGSKVYLGKLAGH